MSLIIHLRQRINVVETIKKTTNAMRLISMSIHSRLRQKKGSLDAYRSEIERMLTHLQHYDTIKTHQESVPARTLIILVGSQKGLCGTFNASLFHYFEKELLPLPKNTDLIVIGKQAVDYSKNHHLHPSAVYNDFSASNFIAIAHELTQTILFDSSYTNVITVSNYPKTFFIQKSEKKQIIPAPITLSENASSIHEDYILEQPASELLDYLKKLSIKVTIQELLFESLVAEQAARFLSMNSSTINADKLITSMKLDYNKLRQASITRELTDLAGSLL